MSVSPAGPAQAATVAGLITDAPQGVVVLAFVVLVALALVLPYLAYRRRSRGEPREEPARIDPVFGEVRYDPEILYWRGRASFAPLDRRIAVDVGDDNEGLFATQRGWFEELERRYPVMQSAIEQLVQSSSRCSETFDNLRLDRVNFPDHPTEDVDFALGYTSASTRWAYWITVEGWKPTGLQRVRKTIWES